MENYLLLVKQAKNGDTKAFASLYEIVYEDMYRFALYTLKNPEDAKDVVSDTVLDAFATIGKLKSEEAFGTGYLKYYPINVSGCWEVTGHGAKN